MASFALNQRRRGWSKVLLIGAAGIVAIIIVSVLSALAVYFNALRPVSSDSAARTFVVGSGASLDEVATNLKKDNLIRESWAFQRYASLHGLGARLQAGTYKIAPNQGVAAIVSIMAEGKVSTELVTILPAQRIDQVRDELIHANFSAEAVDAALDPAAWASLPLLADKPASANLEGYLYPDSYAREGLTDPKLVVQQALEAMNNRLTPDIRAGIAAHGLSLYQGITMASMVEREASRPADRTQVAQVIYKRLSLGMSLESDPTAFYGAIKDGKPPTLGYNSQYNTYKIKGLPVGPISNVSENSLNAVAHPANTDWLYFVAGDDGNTYFSKTLADHEALTSKYCKKLCGR